MRHFKFMVFAFAVFSLLMSAIPEDAEAGRGRSSSSRSSSSWGRSSSSRSSGSSWGRSSKPKSSGSSWGRSKPKSSSSSKKSGSWGSSNKKSKSSWNKPTTSRNASTRAKSIQKASKSRANRQYKAAQSRIKNTSSKDWKSSKSTYAQSRGYTPRNDVKYGPRYSNDRRVIVQNNYYNSYGGRWYNDPFDHSMIWGFSTLWWFHHWSTIDHHHHRQDARYLEMKLEIEKLKAQGMKQNPGYVDEGMDPTVAYSEGYMQAVQNGQVDPSKVQDPEAVQLMRQAAQMQKQEEARARIEEQRRQADAEVAALFFKIMGIILLLAIGGFLAYHFWNRKNNRSYY